MASSGAFCSFNKRHVQSGEWENFSQETERSAVLPVTLRTSYANHRCTVLPSRSSPDQTKNDRSRHASRSRGASSCTSLVSFYF